MTIFLPLELVLQQKELLMVWIVVISVINYWYQFVIFSRVCSESEHLEHELIIGPKTGDNLISK